MADHRSEIIELIEKSYSLRDGSAAKIQLLQQAIQMSDAHQDIALQYQSRLSMLETATFSGFEEQAIAAFGFCLACSDADPQHYPIQSLLWKFKYILESVADFPQIGAAQIQDMFEQMSTRYRDNGYSQRPVHVIKARALSRMGHLQEAAQHAGEYKQYPRDRYADCSTCELDLEVEACIWSEDHAKALELARPIIAGGRSCAEVPHMTFANLLFPTLILERLEEAAALHEKGYRRIARNRCFLGHIAKHMFYLMQIGNMEKAVELFEKHLPWALETREILKRLEFYIAALTLLEKLPQPNTKTLRMPKSFPIKKSSTGWRNGDLTGWFLQQAQQLASQFDRRNGNTCYQTRLNHRHKTVYH